MIVINVDDKTSEREAVYVYELWNVIKNRELPETAYVRFPNGRYVRLTVGDAHGEENI